jgi:hypothetical protein
MKNTENSYRSAPRRALLACTCAVSLAGCVPAQTLDSQPYETMMPAYTAATQHPHSVRVEVVGVARSDAVDISDAHF